MAKAQSLLEQAKSVAPNKSHKKDFSQDEIDLVFAWVRNEVSIGQVARVLGYPKNSSACYPYLAGALKYSLQNNKVKL